MSWVGQALVAMVVMAGYTMLVPFMLKNFNLPGETTITLWMIGAATGVAIFSKSLIFPAGSTPWLSIIVVLLIGLSFGTLMNVTITRAIIEAPNPAYPLMILNLAAAVVLIAAPILYFFFSNMFAEATFSIRGLSGLGLGLVGIWLVSTA